MIGWFSRDGGQLRPAESSDQSIASEVAAIRPVHAENEILPDPWSADAESALTPEFPDADLWSYLDTQEGLFESELPVHGHNSVDDKVFSSLIERGSSRRIFARTRPSCAAFTSTHSAPYRRCSRSKQFLDDPDELKRKELIDACARAARVRRLLGHEVV